MKILVTGGAGFIGSHIVEHFQGRAEIRVLDNLRTGCRENLAGLEYTFIEGSIVDRQLVREAMHQIDYVFHLAAMISVPESMGKPIECVRINTEGTLVVLEEAARAGVKKLAFSSSAAIYGDNPDLPKTENMNPEPKSPYAVTKLDGEYYCMMFKREGLLDAVAMRYFNVFGPRQNPRSQYAAAVPIFVDRAVRGEDITVFGDGEQTRDFIYVKDVARANEHLISHPDTTGVYNVACGQSMTISELARKIIHITGSSSSVEHGPDRPGDVKHSLASVQKLAVTGFSSRTDLEFGLKQIIGRRSSGFPDGDLT